MTETDVDEHQKATDRAAEMTRLWEIADQARALARSYSRAEEALDVLDMTDPPPRSERTELDRDDSMVAPPDPMPPTFEDSEEDDPPDPGAPPPLSWGTLARAALALGTAALTGWAGSLQLQHAVGSDGVAGAPSILWLPGALVALASSGAAVSLRRDAAGPTPSGAPRRRNRRWSAVAVAVFVCGTGVTAGVLGLWTHWWTGTPVLVGLALAVGVVALLAQVPPRAPGPVSWAPPGSLWGLAAQWARAVRGRRADRRTARRWRQRRGRARAAIRAHTADWQAVHHRCHLEVDLHNAQATQLAEALIVLRGSMFGRELPGDSDQAPGMAPLVGSLEVAVHGLTSYHPDRLTRRLRQSNELVRGKHS